MIVSKAFFDLQLQFAAAVAARSGLPLTRVVLDYTNLYIRFGLGRDFDPAHPVWQEYAAGLSDGSDGRDWTYRFYRTRPPAVEPPGIVATFGCFAYARTGADRIRLHFHNAETDDRSPLASERCEQRRAELVALVAHVRRGTREPVQVVGASWLYNLEAYRRLFPASYLATARVLLGRFRHMPLWGQFVNRFGEANEPAAKELLARVGQLSSLAALDDCFPFQVLGLQAPLDAFPGA